LPAKRGTIGGNLMGVIMSVTGETTIAQSGKALSTMVDGEAVLIGIETGRYYGLDAVGTAIWNRIEQPCSFDDLCAGLAEEFEGDPAVIEDETRVFLTQLIERELVSAS
jgi:hypothetical protein